MPDQAHGEMILKDGTEFQDWLGAGAGVDIVDSTCGQGDSGGLLTYGQLMCVAVGCICIPEPWS